MRDNLTGAGNESRATEGGVYLDARFDAGEQG